jgi:hypothetical protein
MQDLKLYLLNTSTLVMSFSQIDTILKIILLGASIGYTFQRWYLLDQDRRQTNEKKKKDK